MPYAHPTVEHFIPLFVTLGAATDPEAPRDVDDRRLLDGPVEALPAGRLIDAHTAALESPSMGNAWPEMVRACGPARNSTSAAMSAGAMNCLTD